eukprot:scaffold10659_cov96-Isochrysis_galbana.AAC.5
MAKTAACAGNAMHAAGAMACAPPRRAGHGAWRAAPAWQPPTWPAWPRTGHSPAPAGSRREWRGRVPGLGSARTATGEQRSAGRASDFHQLRQRTSRAAGACRMCTWASAAACAPDAAAPRPRAGLLRAGREPRLKVEGARRAAASRRRPPLQSRRRTPRGAGAPAEARGAGTARPSPTGVPRVAAAWPGAAWSPAIGAETDQPHLAGAESVLAPSFSIPHPCLPTGHRASAAPSMTLCRRAQRTHGSLSPVLAAE